MYQTPMRRNRSNAVGALAAGLLSAPLLFGFGPAPEAQPERALYLDLQKIVDSRARFEWVADRIEAEEAARQAMRSLCQVDAAGRERLRTWIAAEIQARGGPAATQFAAGVPLGDLGKVMRLERVRVVMDVVEPRLPGECGFWSRPDPAFAGVQTDAHRFVIFVESNGGGQLYLNYHPLTFGGTGAGRMLLGYGLDDRFTLSAGPELGAASTFPRDEKTGTRSVKAAFLAGAPLVLRYVHSTFLLDSELGVTARAPEDDLEGWQFGYRAMIGLGTSEPRIGDFMGYLLFTMGYELVPGNDHHETAHILRLGTRLGFDWDP
jgi:hypothetical protein